MTTTDKTVVALAVALILVAIGWWAIWGACYLLAAAVVKLAEALK